MHRRRGNGDGDETKPFRKGDEVVVPAGTLHRLEGGPSGVTILEIWPGGGDEDDIERVEDDYGRAPGTP